VGNGFSPLFLRHGDRAAPGRSPTGHRADGRCIGVAGQWVVSGGMERLELFATASLTDEQRALYDTLTGGTRAGGPVSMVDDQGRLRGPFNAMLLDPSIGTKVQVLGAALRFGDHLPKRAKELAILTIARARGSEFERTAHEAIALSIGLDQASLDAVRVGRFDLLADDDERFIATTADVLVRTGRLTDTHYAEASDRLGLPTLYALTTLVGYYAMLAMQLSVFGVDVPNAPAE
jgi:4-carboxymuconolactone decarboxylase